MKKSIILTATAAIALSFASCGTPSPESAAEEALETASTARKAHNSIFGNLADVLGEKKVAESIVYKEERNKLNSERDNAESAEDYSKGQKAIQEFQKEYLTPAFDIINKRMKEKIKVVTDSLIGKEIPVVYDTANYSSLKVRYAEFFYDKFDILNVKFEGEAIVNNPDPSKENYYAGYAFDKNKVKYEDVKEYVQMGECQFIAPNKVKFEFSTSVEYHLFKETLKVSIGSY